MAAISKPKTKVADLCRELGVTRQFTLYIGSPRILMAGIKI